MKVPPMPNRGDVVCANARKELRMRFILIKKQVLSLIAFKQRRLDNSTKTMQIVSKAPYYTVSI